MRLMTVLGTLVLIGMIAIPVSADIVPNEPEVRPDDPAARETVRLKLDKLGVDPLEAARIAGTMRTEDARFFARSPRANTVVAGLWLEEWIGAAIYLALIGPYIYENWARYMFLREED